MLFFLQFQSGSAQSGRKIPVGDIRGALVRKSKFYPGTERNYWLYIPKQNDASKPAATMVVEDGLSRATHAVKYVCRAIGIRGGLSSRSVPEAGDTATK